MKSHSILYLKLLFIAVFLSSAKISLANTLDDSIQIKKRKPVYVFQIDRRNSFIKSHHIGINGVLLGVQYKSIHQFSVGFYFLEPWKKPSVITRQDSLLGSYRESVKFNVYYGSIGYRYTFLQKGILSMSIPVEAGFGMGHSKVVLLDYHAQAAAHAYFIPVQIGYFVRLRITKWFAIFGSVGYRTQILEKLFEKPGLQINYNGMYYHYGVSLYIKRIIQDIKGLKGKRKLQ